MKRRVKQIIFLLIVVILLLLGIIVFLKIQENKQILSTYFQENEEDDTVVYDGKRYRYNDDLDNYLFMGIDTMEPIETYEVRGTSGQADSIYLLVYNRQTRQICGLAIPRDTITDIHVIAADGTDLGNKKDHINIQYAFGDGERESCELMREAVSNLLYGVPIRGYCALNMESIPIATEAIGGVELTVPDNTLAAVNADFYEGNHVTITRETAEQFVRYRDITQSQSAISRMDRQKVFIKAFATKAKTMASQQKNFIVDMYESVEDYMVTNMSVELFADLANSADVSEKKIANLPGKGIDGEDFDEYYINEEQLYELILQIFYEEV